MLLPRDPGARRSACVHPQSSPEAAWSTPGCLRVAPRAHSTITAPTTGRCAGSPTTSGRIAASAAKRTTPAAEFFCVYISIFVEGKNHERARAAHLVAKDMRADLLRRAVAEALGSAFLLAAVVGSGIMGERLAGGNVALALLAEHIRNRRRAGRVDPHLWGQFPGRTSIPR